jgi:hypothetical protein
MSIELTRPSGHGGIIEYSQLTSEELSEVVAREDPLGRRILVECASRGIPKSKVAKTLGRSTKYLNQRYYARREFRDAYYSLLDRQTQSLISIATLAKRDAIYAYSKLYSLSQSDEVPANIQLQASKDLIDIAYPKGSEVATVSIQSLLIRIQQEQISPSDNIPGGRVVDLPYPTTEKTP